MASFEGGAPTDYKAGLTAPPKDTRVQTEVSWAASKFSLGSSVNMAGRALCLHHVRALDRRRLTHIFFVPLAA